MVQNGKRKIKEEQVYITFLKKRERHETDFFPSTRFKIVTLLDVFLCHHILPNIS